MYSFKRTEYWNNLKTIGSKASGTIAFMCPKCYNVELFEGKIGCVLTPKRKLKKKDIYEYLMLDMSISYKCTSCEEYAEQIFLDPNIAIAISILNKKGFYTVFCCEGHHETTIETKDKRLSQENPYIYFKDDTILSYISGDFPLPKTWFVDNKEPGMTIIRSKNSKENRIEDINIWVGMLPMLTNNHSITKLDNSLDKLIDTYMNKCIPFEIYKNFCEQLISISNAYPDVDFDLRKFKWNEPEYINKLLEDLKNKLYIKRNVKVLICDNNYYIYILKDLS